MKFIFFNPFSLEFFFLFLEKKNVKGKSLD